MKNNFPEQRFVVYGRAEEEERKDAGIAPGTEDRPIKYRSIPLALVAEFDDNQVTKF